MMDKRIIAVVSLLGLVIAAAVVFAVLRGAVRPGVGEPILPPSAPSLPVGEQDAPALPSDEIERVLDVSVVEVLGDRLVLRWGRKESTTGVVRYGRTTEYELGTVTEETAAMTHDTSLTGLAADTMYHVEITARTADGSEFKSGDMSFETFSPAPVTRTGETVYEAAARFVAATLNGKTLEDLVLPTGARLLTREEKRHFGYPRGADVTAMVVTTNGKETVRVGYDTAVVDADHDALPDDLEKEVGTEPGIPDTDDDGLSDGFEYYVTKTDPLVLNSL